MNLKLKKLIEELKQIVKTDYFVADSYDVIEQIEQLENPFEAIEPILTLIEENPNADLGNPGPLVHFVEGFYKKGYELLLLKSVVKSPTLHSLSMLNRLINGSEGDLKESYIKVLKLISNNIHLNIELRDKATDYLNLHLE